MHGEHPRSSSASLLEGLYKAASCSTCAWPVLRECAAPEAVTNAKYCDKSFVFFVRHSWAILQNLHTFAWHTFAHLCTVLHSLHLVFSVMFICRICGGVKRSGWKRQQKWYGDNVYNKVHCTATSPNLILTGPLIEAWPSCWHTFWNILWDNWLNWRYLAVLYRLYRLYPSMAGGGPLFAWHWRRSHHLGAGKAWRGQQSGSLPLKQHKEFRGHLYNGIIWHLNHPIHISLRTPPEDFQRPLAGSFLDWECLGTYRTRKYLNQTPGHHTDLRVKRSAWHSNVVGLRFMTQCIASLEVSDSFSTQLECQVLNALASMPLLAEFCQGDSAVLPQRFNMFRPVRFTSESSWGSCWNTKRTPLKQTQTNPKVFKKFQEYS